MIDRMVEGMVSLDIQGNIEYANKQALHLLNVSDACNNIWELCTQYSLQELQLEFQQTITQQCERHCEVLLALHQPVWLEIHMYPSIDGVTMMLRDITEKKEIEKTIQDNHLKHVLLNEAAHHIISADEPKPMLDQLFTKLADYLDLDIYFNYMYDKESNRLKLLNFQGISDDTAKEIEWLEFGEAVCGYVAESKVRMVVEHINKSDHPRVQLVKGFGIKTYACHPLISYGRLIGTLSFGSSKRSQFTQDELNMIEIICNQVAIALERFLFISELKRSKEEADKANKAKSDFLSMISHELRTPLNTIVGYTNILLECTNERLSSYQEHKLQRIEESSMRLLNLINTIINITSLDSHEPLLYVTRSINLGDIIPETILNIQNYAAIKNIRIIDQTQPFHNKCFLADPYRLTQVIHNLLSNAIKYNHDEGIVYISCEWNHSSMTLFIKDTGIGISDDEVKNIFSPFYRVFHLHYNIEGSGLGLTLSKKWIEEMNGSIDVTSKLGEGSTFSITLPLTNKENSK